MRPDIVKDLGLLALGTRFKRIGERLQAQTQAVLDSSGVGAPASQFPLLAALDKLGPMSVGEMAEALGVSQPGVSRQVRNLEAEGWVQVQSSAGDQRSRTIGLTRAGRQLVTRARQVHWPAIESAVADACAAEGPQLLRLLCALEDALTDESLGQRARRLAPARGST